MPPGPAPPGGDATKGPVVNDNTAAKRPVSFRPSPDLADWLGGRADRMHAASPGEQARIELGMWRDLLAMELRRIRLTLPQASCIADILGGHLMSPGLGYRPGLVYAEVADAFHIAAEGPVPGCSTYGEKWGIDEDALLAYLAELNPAADHALMDALCRWWAQDSEPTQEGFAKVGITVIPAERQ
ncbi:MAG TPA: hypothetical protein VJ277_14285 [Gemmatimonadales bacterium]|nr:hypothetical protein [Gemmatimonadales bacterium]